MYLLNLSHFDKKPQNESAQKPSPVSSALPPTPGPGVAGELTHQRGRRHPSGKKETQSGKLVVFSLERRAGAEATDGSPAGERGGRGAKLSLWGTGPQGQDRPSGSSHRGEWGGSPGDPAWGFLSISSSCTLCRRFQLLRDQHRTFLCQYGGFSAEPPA